MKSQPIPVSFRSAEVDQILTALRAGESCTIVGIGSVGKSNLLRFLQQDDVHQAKLGPDSDTFLFVYLDANKLLKESLWGLWELMLHQLLIGLIDHGAHDAAIETVDDLHQRSTEPSTQHLALRYVDRAIRVVCRQLDLRLVFLVDEFDNLCRLLAPRGFSALRALRDDQKYRLMYVLATRMELSRLREEVEEIESFEELVSINTIWLGPYSERDARHMVRRLNTRHRSDLDEETADDLLMATGGHPGLLRAAYRVAIEHPADLPRTLALSPLVQDECRRLWLSLSAEEQRAITMLANAVNANPHQRETLERLRHKKLVGGPWADDDDVFSPLFAEYVREQQPVVGARIHVDRKRRMMLVNGHAVKRLPPLEYKFIEYLEERRGHVCSRDDLAQHLYPEDMAVGAQGVSDARLDAIVKRLRKRIKSVGGNPRYILTVRGHGFRLVDTDESAG